MSRDQTILNYVTAHRDNVKAKMAEKRALPNLDVLLTALVELYREPLPRSDLRSNPVRYDYSRNKFVSFGSRLALYRLRDFPIENRWPSNQSFQNMPFKNNIR